MLAWLLLLPIAACSQPAWRSFSLDTADHNAQWMVRNWNKSIHLPATVPGGIYTDLEANNVIDDIMLDYNDVRTRWVAHDIWAYIGNFSVSGDLLRYNVHQLVFNGLDTIAFVTLNDVPIGTTDNMFVTYRFDVKSKLKEGVNKLELQFRSPVEAAAQLSSASFTAPNCVPRDYNGECHVNQLRKMQASFGWDWGPAFPSVGIWRNVGLEFFDEVKISAITTKLDKSEDKWNIHATAHFEADKRAHKIEGNLDATLITADSSITTSKKVQLSVRFDGTAEADIVLTVSQNQVELWWPNGYGNQKLYALSLKFKTEISEPVFHSVNIGFRTIELVEDEAWTVLGNDTMGAEGLTFYFKVNGYPLFMKGSNLIPIHILPERGGDKELVDSVLGAAREAHMSMVRVWGGGVYQSDYFYDACDRLGILVWQDLMFACSMYPATREFLTSVVKEVEQNVVRLQHHPSIALWAGNNENEAALVGDWYNTGDDAQKYKAEYIELYVNTIKPIVEYLDPTRRYLVSSPSNGRHSESSGYISDNPYDPLYGDTHFYNYLADAWDPIIFPKTRFSSEYGFQSSPSLSTLASATRSKTIFELDDDFLQHRQHSPNGNGYVVQQIRMHFQLDLRDPNYKDKFVFYSQIVQAMAMKAETEFYRQNQESWYTMGALYWQLNDVWQAPTWSGIEYGGKWKMLHYYAKWFFAPVLITGTSRVPGVDAGAVLLNDRFVPIENAEVLVEYFNWTSLIPIRAERYPASAPALGAKKLNFTLNFYNDFSLHEMFLRYSLKADGVETSPYNYVFPAPFKDVVGLRMPKIQIAVQDKVDYTDGRYTYHLKVIVDTVVLFLWLETNYPGHFSDNGLILAQAQTAIQFYSNESMKHFELERSITHKCYLH